MPIFRINGKNILFMHVPKAGGTSIERWLSTYSEINFHLPRKSPQFPCVPQHFHAEVIRTLFSDAFFDYRFLIVRNPYQRLLSEYNYRMGHRRRRERILPPPGFARWLRRVLRQYRADPYVFSNHIRPQTDFMMAGAEFFRLESDLPELRERLSALCAIADTEEIPRTNRSVRREDTISASAAEMLYDFYRQDFETFGYAPDSYLEHRASTAT